jgi:hypothetical protein
MLNVGIDDSATATQMSEGWAFILLPQSGVQQLQNEAAGLSATPFHASSSSKRNLAKYERFLTAVRNVVAKSEPHLLVHVFDDPSWHQGLGDIGKKLIEMGQAALKTDQIQVEPRVEEALKHMLPPLLSLQRISSHRGLQNDQVEVWLDESGKTRDFGSMRVGAGLSISAVGIAKSLYNAYRATNFPSSPEMVRNGLHVLPDSQSILIQAADVFGNFAAACAAWKLGATNIRQLRGEVFERVFGDQDLSQVLRSLSLQGDHLEVALRVPGGLKLEIS